MNNELTAMRLREALTEAGLRPQDLADKSGVSKSSISQYLKGSHSPSNISSGKMADVLNVSPLWLMGFDVEKITPEAKAKMRMTAYMDGLGYLEKELLNRFNKLNSVGKSKALEQLQDLIEISRYRKENIL